MPEPLNDLDLVELSDLAWGVVDPEDGYEAEEVAWVALLRAGWPPIAGDQELRLRLRSLAEALAPRAPAVPLRVVAAVMAFLAADPQRRNGAAVVTDALREEFSDGELPGDVAEWLDARRRSPSPHRRRHGARRPQRHFHGRPAVPSAPPRP